MRKPHSDIPGADIEDLFTPSEYLTFYNGTYSKAVKVADLSGRDRIVKRLARKEGAFDHGEVGAYFLRNLPASLKSLSKGTLDRFEAVLRDITRAIG